SWEVRAGRARASSPRRRDGRSSAGRDTRADRCLLSHTERGRSARAKRCTLEKRACPGLRPTWTRLRDASLCRAASSRSRGGDGNGGAALAPSPFSTLSDRFRASGIRRGVYDNRCPLGAAPGASSPWIHAPSLDGSRGELLRPSKGRRIGTLGWDACATSDWPWTAPTPSQ